MCFIFCSLSNQKHLSWIKHVWDPVICVLLLICTDQCLPARGYWCSCQGGNYIKKIEIIIKIVLILDKSKLVIILDKANQNYCNYCSYCSAARPLQVHYLISFKSKFIILASCFECQCSSVCQETHTQKAKK